MRSGRTAVAAVEGAVTAAAGGALAGATWSVVGAGVPAAVIGGLNGLISGARGTYHWRRANGPVAFTLDSTWGLPMTFAALAAHAVAAAQRGGSGYVRELSRRQDRHVYVRGLRFRNGFVMTMGNTINGTGESVRTSDRRWQLVTDHEDVHVWQARWWGPLFPVLYVGWSVVGGAVGAVVWLVRQRDQPFTKVVETCAYYLNPFEWWAYSRDGFWPPRQKVVGVGWTAPAVRPFSATARRSGRGRGGSRAGPR